MHLASCDRKTVCCSLLVLQVSQAENPTCNRMSLPAFLIWPMQRITRYPLLVSKLLHHTSKRSAEHDALLECMNQLGQLLDKINKVQRIILISPFGGAVSDNDVKFFILCQSNSAAINRETFCLPALPCTKFEAQTRLYLPETFLRSVWVVFLGERRL